MLTSMASAAAAIACCYHGVGKCAALLQQSEAGELTVWLTTLLLQDLLVSKISRKSIELLKKHFMDDMTRDDWRLVVKLKKTFQID